MAAVKHERLSDAIGAVCKDHIDGLPGISGAGRGEGVKSLGWTCQAAFASDADDPRCGQGWNREERG
jgi:hypothetical protein